MSSNTDPYLEAYEKLVRNAQSFRYLPWTFACRLGALLGSRSSHFREHREKIEIAMQTNLGCSTREVESQIMKMFASSGIAAQSYWELEKIDKSWVNRWCAMDGGSCWGDLRKQGGLVLSHHSMFHNLLVRVFGVVGLKTFPIASSPDGYSKLAYPDSTYMQEFTRYLDKSSTGCLSGGRPIYIDGNRRNFHGEVTEVFGNQSIILAFADFNEPRPRNAEHPFLKATLRPPVGLMRLAVKQRAPVFFASNYWDLEKNKYSICLDSMRGCNTVGELAASYVKRIEAQVRAVPYSWQGWDYAF